MIFSYRCRVGAGENPVRRTNSPDAASSYTGTPISDPARNKTELPRAKVQLAPPPEMGLGSPFNNAMP